MDKQNIKNEVTGRSKEPNQNGIKAIVEKMTKKTLESKIHRKTKTKNYIAETTKEIINQIFSN